MAQFSIYTRAQDGEALSTDPDPCEYPSYLFSQAWCQHDAYITLTLAQNTKVHDQKSLYAGIPTTKLLAVSQDCFDADNRTFEHLFEVLDMCPPSTMELLYNFESVIC